MQSAPGHLPLERRKVNVFVLAMICLAVMISLRNLPITAEYGIGSIFFYVAAALVFMVPYALISAELASGWPKSGGVYIWVREAFGERWGFFAIWMQWFHNMTWYPAMLAFAATGVAYSIDNPALAQNKTYLMTFILAGMWGITFFNFLGIKTSTWISTTCVILGVLVPGAILISMGMAWIFQGNPTFLHSEIIPDLSHPSNLVFLAGIFLALSGLEANANLAREVKHPQKNYPRAILIAALICLSVLILGSISIAAVIPKEQIGLLSGVYETFRYFFLTHHLEWLIPIVALFIVLGAFGELNAWAIASTKGLFVTTEHGSLPPFFHKLNSRFVPTRLLLFQAIIVSISTLIFLYLPDVNISYWVLSALSAQMYLAMYILLLLAGLVLRYKKSHVHRVYKIPGKNIGISIAATIGILSSLFALFLSFLPPQEFVVGDLFTYEAILLSGFIISCLIPLAIHFFRKPSWQSAVLAEIREEIHRSTH